MAETELHDCLRRSQASYRMVVAKVNLMSIVGQELKAYYGGLTFAPGCSQTGPQTGVADVAEICTPIATMSEEE